jgi:hypothetical protein
MIHENVIITVCYSLAVGWQHLMPLASLLSFCAVLVLISSLLAQGKSRRRGRKDDGERIEEEEGRIISCKEFTIKLSQFCKLLILYHITCSILRCMSLAAMECNI